ncbi:MAG: DUF2090 domain-containing protein [Burkholderiaceae bacterium]
MNLGYDNALYLLPFDHRNSYITGMFGLEMPLSAQQHERVSDSKRLIYAGFVQALDGGVRRDRAGILVDEEFGADLLRDAHQRGVVTAVSVERSGSDEFEFEYGDDYARHIEAFAPTFAKVLVRYNPQGDAALNRRQNGRLAQLSQYCRRAGQRFMFELLVPATEAQMKRVEGDKNAFDRQVRPALMEQAIRALQDAGVEPDVWKIEGLARRDDCERMVETARRDGRAAVGCIVLGRGADVTKVREWLAVAAGVDGFIGFAVSRTSFWDAVKGFDAQTLTREQALAQIAQRFRQWVDVFEGARVLRAGAASSANGAIQ